MVGPILQNNEQQVCCYRQGDSDDLVLHRHERGFSLGPPAAGRPLLGKLPAQSCSRDGHRGCVPQETRLGPDNASGQGTEVRHHPRSEAEIFSVPRHPSPFHAGAVPAFQPGIILIRALFLSHCSQSSLAHLHCSFTFQSSYCCFCFRALLMDFYSYFTLLFLFLVPITLTSQLLLSSALFSTLISLLPGLIAAG